MGDPITLADVSHLHLEEQEVTPPAAVSKTEISQNSNDKSRLLSDIQDIASHVSPPRIPAHRSHDSSNNLKRSDPFQFGSRYLEENDDIFEWNAWDHVKPDEIYNTYAEHQYIFQRENPVADFDKQRFNNDPAKWWNKFYTNNTSNFFKNRKWLQQEFPILSQMTSNSTSEPVERSSESHGHVQGGQESVILEVGAGAGNTAFPILAANENPNLTIHACDFSRKAVDIIRSNPAYDEKHIKASVWDISSTIETLPPGVQPGTVDVVLLIFIFSALNPSQWAQAISNVHVALKPGGEICFRDYGRGDLAQVRFKKGRYMDENFYIRGDGTRVYFFGEDELREIWTGQGARAYHDTDKSLSTSKDQLKGSREEHLGRVSGAEEAAMIPEDEQTMASSSEKPSFEMISLGADRRMLVNRQKQLKMYRCWMQARIKKI